MTLTTVTVALWVGLALAYRLLMPSRWRGWALMLMSAVSLYALQPRLVIYYTDFALPSLMLGLAVWGWFITRKPDEQPRLTRDDWIALVLIVGVVVGMTLFRYVAADYRLTASRPPQTGLVLIIALAALLPLVGYRSGMQRAWLVGGLSALVALFIVFKTEPLAAALSTLVRSWTGQDPTLARAIDWGWLGFSYAAFRLLHTLRDRQSGLLPAISLRDYVTYIIFFPSWIAGPIDRAERFQGDMAALHEQPRWDADRWREGIGRIVSGLVKKFVLADSLALGAALDAGHITQGADGVWLWVLLYGYALRLFFDFSGYSDIAIGVGILFGIRLPENFNAPYLKTDITKFWQSWHITLSTWARFYVFSPLTRSLLRRKPKPSAAVVALLTQTATMLVIGLWHGVTWNFVVWGLWHGVALFVHKLWTDRTRKWERQHKGTRLHQAYIGAAWFVTFHYAVLGWVWFAMPTLHDSLTVFARLFGWGG